MAKLPPLRRNAGDLLRSQLRKRESKRINGNTHTNQRSLLPCVMWLFLLLPSSVDTVRLRGIGTEPIGTILIRASRSRTVQCTTIAIYLHRAVRTPSVVGLKGSWTKIPCHLGAHRSGLRLSIWRSLLIKPHTPHAHRTYTALMMYDTPHSGAPAPPRSAAC